MINALADLTRAVRDAIAEAEVVRSHAQKNGIAWMTEDAEMTMGNLSALDRQIQGSSLASCQGVGLSFGRGVSEWATGHAIAERLMNLAYEIDDQYAKWVNGDA